MAASSRGSIADAELVDAAAPSGWTPTFDDRIRAGRRTCGRGSGSSPAAAVPAARELEARRRGDVRRERRGRDDVHAANLVDTVRVATAFWPLTPPGFVTGSRAGGRRREARAPRPRASSPCRLGVAAGRRDASRRRTRRPRRRRLSRRGDRAAAATGPRGDGPEEPHLRSAGPAGAARHGDRVHQQRRRAAQRLHALRASPASSTSVPTAAARRAGSPLDQAGRRGRTLQHPHGDGGAHRGGRRSRPSPSTRCRRGVRNPDVPPGRTVAPVASRLAACTPRSRGRDPDGRRRRTVRRRSRSAHERCEAASTRGAPRCSSGTCSR